MNSATTLGVSAGRDRAKVKARARDKDRVRVKVKETRLLRHKTLNLMITIF